MRFIFVLLLSLTACRTTEHSHQAFDDPNAWAKEFDDPSRDSWQRPDEVLSALHLKADSEIADLGSATGYFSVRLARAAPKGRVYGCDVESAMVDYLNHRAETEGITNLTSILATYDDAKIPEPVDVVLIVDTYHHIDSRPAYFAKLANSVKPGGRVAIIDFSPESRMGPAPEARITPEQVQKEMEEAGWTLETSHPFLPEQYFLTFLRHR